MDKAGSDDTNLLTKNQQTLKHANPLFNFLLETEFFINITAGGMLSRLITNISKYPFQKKVREDMISSKASGKA